MDSRPPPVPWIRIIAESLSHSKDHISISNTPTTQKETQVKDGSISSGVKSELGLVENISNGVRHSKRARKAVDYRESVK